MQNDWGALGLGGGVGRVDIRGATPPIGGTGPGGVEGMGLLALLRRLSMGLDEGGGSGLPTQMTPDPAAQSGMSNTLGGGVQGGSDGFPEGFDPVQAMAGQMPGPAPAIPGQMGQMQPPIPVAPSPGGMAGMMATEPGQEDQWAELRRLGVPY